MSEGFTELRTEPKPRILITEEWDGDPARRRTAQIPDDVTCAPKSQLALALLDRLASWELRAPVVVADCGYGRGVGFRLALEERGLSYAVAVEAKEVAHPEHARPCLPAYGGLGPPTLPRYRTPPIPLTQLAAAYAQFTDVSWRQGSKGAMRSRFAALQIRPAGKQSLRQAQEAGGGHYAWDGVLPLRTLLVEQSVTASEPTGYWVTNLPTTTPIAHLVRLAKMRWPIEHDYRELKHGLGLDHFEGRSWRGWHHHDTLVSAAQAFLTLRRLDPNARTPASPSTRSST
ncbi:IS701 family transposase [Streptomyces alboflavus]|uniref:IS701 family transposase n=1 Tax=Streptomyces alboflavus TaxID=67267 RepID=UPI003674567F